MSIPRTSLSWLAGLVVLLLVGAGGWSFMRGDRAQPVVTDTPQLTQESDQKVQPPAPLPTSPFLNTNVAVAWTGSEACRECHAGHDASFRRTGMGRSMALVEPGLEPPDGQFDHALSGRRYHIERSNGQLWHREVALSPAVPDPAAPSAAEAPPESALALGSFPLKYVVGSGRHSRTYLVEADGFLVESPITWYAAKQTWGMSPGYNQRGQLSFARPVGEGCVGCHAGQSRAVDQSLHRMEFTELSISCERCHGAGSLHVEQRRKERAAEQGGLSAVVDRPAATSIDHTIVNPRHLSRELSEAVCQQCHLRSTATIFSRGADFQSFRPGLPLQVFRQDFALEESGKPMTVVGHVEQLHLSACWNKSATLSCVTCHDPHDEPVEAAKADYYRQRCLSCHQTESCRAPVTRRQQTTPADSCVVCHMPVAPTEIPHLAFTHHRIGIHEPQAGTGRPAANTPTGQSNGLRSVLDLSQLDEVERQRSLGLGYLEAASRQPEHEAVEAWRRAAWDLLNRVRAAGRSDETVAAALARLSFDLGHEDTQTNARQALEYPGLKGQDRCNALFLVTESLTLEGKFAEALVPGRELVRQRRNAVDWLLIADCERNLGHTAEAIEALQTAARIQPGMPQVHLGLAGYFDQLGDAAQADWHRRCAKLLPDQP